MHLKILLLVPFVGSIFHGSVLCDKRIPSFAGPYRAYGKRFDNCTDVSTDEAYLKLRVAPPKPGQLQYCWGTCFLNFDITDELGVKIVVDQRSNNQWKKNAFIFKLNRACTTALRSMPNLMRMVFGEEGMKCPLKKGLYDIRNQTIDWSFPDVPIFPYGRWRFTLKLLRKETPIACFMSDCETVPKL